VKLLEVGNDVIVPLKDLTEEKLVSGRREEGGGRRKEVGREKEQRGRGGKRRESQPFWGRQGKEGKGGK
jgi:hypothetical protein